MELVTTGVKYLPGFLHEATRSVRGRVVNGRSARPVTQELAQTYFEQRSDAGHGMDDVIESSSLPYRALLSSKLVRVSLCFLNRASRVLDYGCGRGGLYSTLRRAGFSGKYFGYDVDRIGITRLQETGQHDDATFSTRIKSVGFDLAFLCNVLVYNDDGAASKALEELASLAGTSSQLIVLEPFPRWYWEFVFDGIRLQARGPDAISSLLMSAGWEPREWAAVSLLCLGNIPVCKIAYAVLANAAKR